MNKQQGQLFISTVALFPCLPPGSLNRNDHVPEQAWVNLSKISFVQGKSEHISWMIAVPVDAIQICNLLITY